jgi:hypothetical protein
MNEEKRNRLENRTPIRLTRKSMSGSSRTTVNRCGASEGSVDQHLSRSRSTT